MTRFCSLFLLLIPAALMHAQTDCEVLNVQQLYDNYLGFTVDTVILQPDGSFEIQLSNGTTFTQILGCTDSTYTEYNAAANTDDASCA
ncbi:MAG: hypothetical protein ACPHCT_07080, partial [Flavobacteriales bacterium]